MASGSWSPTSDSSCSSSTFAGCGSSALLTWPGRRPPFYGLLLVLGATLSVLIVYKLVVLRMHPVDVFGETMMLVYYGYAVPLSLKIGRGFYEDGIWADAGFIPYSRIGGSVVARRPGRIGHARADLPDARICAAAAVPHIHYGAARRLLRDKIAAHAIHFTGKPLDLGMHDERDDV